MTQPHSPELSNFFVTGLSYKKTDAAARGNFSLNNDQYKALLETAKDFGVAEVFVLSTCNRTEIYGFAASADQLCALLCTQTAGSLATFNQLSYVLNGEAALQHIFEVAAGLDSQVLGDYEIVGQLKQAVRISREAGCLGATLERMVNEVLQCCKKVRSTTALSGGTVSVSFAAVQCISQHFINQPVPNILLVGTGKIGGNTCRNLVDYLPACRVTLINRSEEKAEALAKEFDLQTRPFQELETAIYDTDVLVIATNASLPFLFPEHFYKNKKLLVIDLSVPCNVDPSVGLMEDVTLMNVDRLSNICDHTLEKRKAAIPAVKQLIAEHLMAFADWLKHRRTIPVLHAVKVALESLHRDTREADVDYTVDAITGQRIQKVISGMAVKLRHRPQPGCHYIEAINDFIKPASN